MVMQRPATASSLPGCVGSSPTSSAAVRAPMREAYKLAEQWMLNPWVQVRILPGPQRHCEDLFASAFYLKDP